MRRIPRAIIPDIDVYMSISLAGPPRWNMQYLCQRGRSGAERANLVKGTSQDLRQV
jgi:hypothetical protein